MKIRSGFVSNSSTSSFVVLGIKIDKPDFPDTEEGDILHDEFNDKTFHIEGDKYILGQSLCMCEDWGLRSAEFTLDKLNELAKELTVKHDVSLSEIKLYMGTRSC